MPGAASVGAVLPGRIRCKAGHVEGAIARERVGVAAARVCCQRDRRCSRICVEHVGLASHGAIVACIVRYFKFERVAAGECDVVPGKRGAGYLARDVGPGGAVVERTVNDVSARGCAAQRGSDRLRSRLGDEVGTADAGVCRERYVAERDAWCCGIEHISLARNRAIIACVVGDLKFERAAAGGRHTIPRERGARNFAGDVGPRRAVVERTINNVSARGCAAQRLSEGLRTRVGYEVSITRTCISSVREPTDRDSRCSGIKYVGLTQCAATVTWGIGDTHLEGIAAGQGLARECTRVLTGGVGGSGPGQ